MIDAGFAYWKSGDNVRAAESFGAGIAILDQLQDRATSERCDPSSDVRDTL